MTASNFLILFGYTLYFLIFTTQFATTPVIFSGPFLIHSPLFDIL